MYFDSLTHPTLDGNWIGGRTGRTFESLAEEMRQHAMLGACVVGLPGVGGYSHEAFFLQASRYPAMYPVAALTSSNLSQADAEFVAIREAGYEAVKIHPRLLGIDDLDITLPSLFKGAHAAGLKVFYCTYYFQSRGQLPDRDPYWSLVRALNAVPDLPVILLHGGGVRLLEHAELCRFSEKLLLDLSFTAIKYAGSSLSADIGFLVRQFDRKLCLGSDHPEYAMADTVRFFEELLIGVNAEKQANIRSNNLRNFLSLQ